MSNVYEILDYYQTANSNICFLYASHNTKSFCFVYKLQTVGTRKPTVPYEQSGFLMAINGFC